MQEKLSVALSGKDATKLLALGTWKGSPKIPSCEQMMIPRLCLRSNFLLSITLCYKLQGKTTGSSSDNIITILQWEKQHTPHLSEEQKGMLEGQKIKTAKLFQFTATNTNPWDEVQFTFWKHKVTNMVRSSIKLALKEDIEQLILQYHNMPNNTYYNIICYYILLFCVLSLSNLYGITYYVIRNA
jgi:hypothetical protein